jgi:hypothetical protein
MLCGLECGLEIIQLCCVLDPAASLSLFAGYLLGLHKFGDRVMAQIVKAKSSGRALHVMYVGFRFSEIG